ncbi:hypothetical protein PUR71_02965 [Streptomyces sp. SP17BM10]|nr:hypothetical protein [Streptomyces sp. SP17BM10]MEE1781895.1 hypothetical protein [Streptomyces sp. SP17BM10]
MAAQRTAAAPRPAPAASPASRYEVILVSLSFRCPLRGRHRGTSATNA